MSLTVTIADAVTGVSQDLVLDDPVVIMKVNTFTDTHTLTKTDVGAIVEMNSASANSLIIPADATTNLPVGTTVQAVQAGAGATTVTPSNGITMHVWSGGSTVLAGQWAVLRLYKRAANEWVLTI